MKGVVARNAFKLLNYMFDGKLVTSAWHHFYEKHYNSVMTIFFKAYLNNTFARSIDKTIWF